MTMSSNTVDNTASSATTGSTPTALKGQDGKKVGTLKADDAQSVMSDTVTLVEAKDTKGQTQKDTNKKGTKLGASSSSFAKKAKEQGWAAPTATRPSFG